MHSKHEKFLELLKPIYDRLTRYIRAMTSDAEEARDILGETLLIGYENFEKVEYTDAFLYYLFAIARRLNLKWQRRRWMFIPFEVCHETLAPASPSPDSQVSAQILSGFIDKLPTRLREAFVLYKISGFSVEEICKLQGGSPAGVRSRIARARKKLETLLADHETNSANRRSMISVFKDMEL